VHPVEKGAIDQDPETLFGTNEQTLSSIGVAAPDEKNIFTGLVRVSDSYIESYKQHQAKEYVIEKMPIINILGIKYLLPMVEGKIDGYYDIKRLDFKDGKPVLRLGSYTPLGSKWIQIYKVKMQPGEVVSYSAMLNLYNA